jgi:Uma2 family endonuclease
MRRGRSDPEGVGMSVGVKPKPVLSPTTIRWDVPPVRVPARAMTLAGFRQWVTSDDFPEKLRASFINQEVVIDMSPEELETHNKVKTEVVGTIHRLSRELDLGELFSDGTRLSNVVAGLSTEPDGIFVSWDSFEANRVRLVPRKDLPDQYMELEGTPDWVLEVLSRWSGFKDTESLLNAYHRAGIPEYWLIDAQHDEISFQILRWRRDRYVAVAARDRWMRSTVFGQSFRLNRRKNRMGRWTYTLEVKPA